LLEGLSVIKVGIWIPEPFECQTNNTRQFEKQVRFQIFRYFFFSCLKNRVNLSSSQIVTISFVGRFILSSIQMIDYQMPGSKVKWTILIRYYSKDLISGGPKTGNIKKREEFVSSFQMLRSSYFRYGFQITVISKMVQRKLIYNHHSIIGLVFRL
jgi:hypothetical protein